MAGWAAAPAANVSKVLCWRTGIALAELCSIVERRMSRRPKKCPECGSKRVAEILYGMPAFSDKLERDLEVGRIDLGGCCVTDNDPEWQCVECEHAWGQAIM